MLYKTEGIALSFIKYKDSSIIVKIYTSKFGMQSYIVNGVRSKKARTRMALFQPLTLLDLVVYHNSNKNIQRISELKCSYSFIDIPFNIRKSSIALFLTEVLAKTLHSEEENELLFQFLKGAIEALDHMEKGYENFHLHLLFKMCRFMGVDPGSAENMVVHSGQLYELTDEEYAFGNSLLNGPIDCALKLNRKQRNKFAEIIITYFHDHFNCSREMKTLEVLREVLG